MAKKQAKTTHELRDGHKVLEITTVSEGGKVVSQGSRYLGSIKKTPALKKLVAEQDKPKKALPKEVVKPEPETLSNEVAHALVDAGEAELGPEVAAQE